MSHSILLRACAVLVAAFFVVGVARAQTESDTTERDTTHSRFKPRWRIRGGASYLTGGINDEYRYAPELQASRSMRDRILGIEPYQGLAFEGAYGTLGDTPLLHFASWSEISATLKPLDGITITGGVRGEWRGASYGTSNTNNVVVQPLMRLRIDTAVRFGSERFGISADLGDLGDITLDQGLTLYNIEAQGLIAHIDWHRLRLGVARIADGVATIGLNTDDFVHFSLGLHELPLGEGWNGSASLIRMLYGTVNEYAEPSFAERGSVYRSAELGDDFLAIGLRVGRTDSLFALYAEGALRDAFGTAGFASRSGLLAGAESRMKGEGWSLSLRGEFRFYGGLFNANYRNDDVFYRDPNYRSQANFSYRSSNGFGNTVGSSLYRLTWYDRPFSQWAVFTEYQGLMDVTAGTLYAAGWYGIGGGMQLGGTLDIAAVGAASAGAVNTFLYTFVDLGIRWRPSQTFWIGASLSNRGMNLNLSYPTLAQITLPTLIFNTRWDLNW